MGTRLSSREDGPPAHGLIRAREVKPVDPSNILACVARAQTALPRGEVYGPLLGPLHRGESARAAVYRSGVGGGFGGAQPRNRVDAPMRPTRALVDPAPCAIFANWRSGRRVPAPPWLYAISIVLGWARLGAIAKSTPDFATALGRDCVTSVESRHRW
jgi:hypothetical protein